MKSDYEIQQALDKLQAGMDTLKEKTPAGQLMSIYGALDCLKWVLNQPSQFHLLIQAADEKPEKSDWEKRTYLR